MRVEAIAEKKTYSISLYAADLVTTSVGAQGIIELPLVVAPGWAVTQLRAETIADFTETGTRTLNVGVPGTATALASAINVDGAGIKSVTLTQYRATSSTPITVQLTTATNNPLTGHVVLTFELTQVLREN